MFIRDNSSKLSREYGTQLSRLDRHETYELYNVCYVLLHTILYSTACIIGRWLYECFQADYYHIIYPGMFSNVKLLIFVFVTSLLILTMNCVWKGSHVCNKGHYFLFRHDL